MRTFYIFKINHDLSILMSEIPYNLYRALEGIYLLNKDSISYGKDLLDQLIIPFDKNELNKEIYEINKDNDFYTKVGDIHTIYNKYRDETTKISVKHSHILLETNTISQNVKNFLPNNNLFACDFVNKDYFWLSKLIHI